MKRFVLPLAALLACGIAGSSAPIQAAAAQADTPQQKLQRALAWLTDMGPSLDAGTRAQMPALQAILRRYYLDDASLTAAEADIAEAITSGMPGGPSPDLVTRDPAEKLKALRAALHKAPGVANKPTFYPGVRSTPGGKSIGYVDVSLEGRRRTVVELLAAPRKTTLAQRARIIARDMQTVQQKQPLWWSQMTVGRAAGEYVVKAPGAPRGYLITADHDFAKEWGLSRPALAGQLVATIRRTFDPQKGSRIAMRDAAPTPAELRDEAVELRQQGDSLYSQDPAQAERLYRAAMEKDPAYPVPYVRVADLCASSRRTPEAREVLQKALAIQALDTETRSDIQRRLQRLR